MLYQLNQILDTKNRDIPLKTLGESKITPERVYKSFQEWRGLGKQDTTEIEIPSKPDQSQGNDKDKTHLEQ